MSSEDQLYKDILKLNIAELRRELEKNTLPTTGRKAEVINKDRFCKTIASVAFIIFSLVTILLSIEERTPLKESNSSSNLKLPRFTLPEFHGNMIEWVSWWDQFKSCIHENNALKTHCQPACFGWTNNTTMQFLTVN